MRRELLLLVGPGLAFAAVCGPACGGAVVFDGPWPSDSGGSTPVGTAGSGVGASSVGTGGAIGIGGSIAIGGSSASASTSAGTGASCGASTCTTFGGSGCQCTATCASTGNVEVDCAPMPGGMSCKCTNLNENIVIGSCMEASTTCDPVGSCCGVVFFPPGD